MRRKNDLLMEYGFDVKKEICCHELRVFLLIFLLTLISTLASRIVGAISHAVRVRYEYAGAQSDAIDQILKELNMYMYSTRRLHAHASTVASSANQLPPSDVIGTHFPSLTRILPACRFSRQPSIGQVTLGQHSDHLSTHYPAHTHRVCQVAHSVGCVNTGVRVALPAAA